MPARAAEAPAAPPDSAAAVAAPPRAALRTAAMFTGIVCSGLGEGARFVAIDWVQREMRRALGFEPWPGTLNLCMAGAAWQRWRRTLARRAGLLLRPAAGFCAARCFVVQLDGRMAAAAVIPDVDGYPDDKLELVAPLALREALSLRDGSLVRVGFLD